MAIEREYGKKIICLFYPRMLQNIDDAAFLECRTRIDLIRQAVREYLRTHHGKEDGISAKSGN